MEYGSKMKKKTSTILIVIATLVLAAISVFIVLRIKSLGIKPVAPNVPESTPKAEESLPQNPSSACLQTFTVATPTPGVSGTPTPTTTPGVSNTPTPTPTTTPGPSATPSPEPSNTPTPGPTSTPPPGAYCDYLKVNIAGGPAPLSVVFEGKGYDPTRVKGFRFYFGDGNQKEILGSYYDSEAVQVSYTYNSTGTYEAKLEIMDDGDHWHTRPECETTVSVTGKTVTSTPGPTTIVQQLSPTEAQLPEAGIKIPALGGMILGFLLISLGVVFIF